MYRVLLFLHLTGAIATFVGVGAWMFIALSFRQAQRRSEIRNLAVSVEMAGMVALSGILTLAITGLAMAVSVWGLQQGWILAGIGAFVLMAPVGPLLVSPRLVRLIRLARADGDDVLSTDQQALTSDPVVKIGLLAMTGDLTGIVFIMTIKPSFYLAVVSVVAFVALSLLMSFPSVGKLIEAVVVALAKLEESNPLYR